MALFRVIRGSVARSIENAGRTLGLRATKLTASHSCRRNASVSGVWLEQSMTLPRPAPRVAPYPPETGRLGWWLARSPEQRPSRSRAPIPCCAPPMAPDPNERPSLKMRYLRHRSLAQSAVPATGHTGKIKLRMLTDGAPPALMQSAWQTSDHAGA
jgi:hypothetical protein